MWWINCGHPVFRLYGKQNWNLVSGCRCYKDTHFQRSLKASLKWWVYIRKVHDTNLSIISPGPWSMPTMSRSCDTASRKASSQNCIWSHRVERSFPIRPATTTAHNLNWSLIYVQSSFANQLILHAVEMHTCFHRCVNLGHRIWGSNTTENLEDMIQKTDTFPFKPWHTWQL
jgi:hypothetical protein